MGTFDSSGAFMSLKVLWGGEWPSGKTGCPWQEPGRTSLLLLLCPLPATAGPVRSTGPRLFSSGVPQKGLPVSLLFGSARGGGGVSSFPSVRRFPPQAPVPTGPLFSAARCLQAARWVSSRR